MQYDMHLSDLSDSERRMVKPLISKKEEEKNPELSVQDVADEIDIHQSNVSRKFRKLEKQGILKHRKSEEDSRKKLYRLSENFDKSIYALRKQEDDLEQIKQYDGIQIQQDETHEQDRQTSDIEIALYGAENELDVEQLGIESNIQEIVEVLRREYAKDLKSQFAEQLEELIEEQFDEEDQEEILDIQSILVEALWQSNELYVEYLQQNVDKYGKAETAKKLMTGPEITAEILSVKDEEIKEVLGKVEGSKEFLRKVYNLLEDTKSMKLVIDV